MASSDLRATDTAHCVACRRAERPGCRMEQAGGGGSGLMGLAVERTSRALGGLTKERWAGGGIFFFLFPMPAGSTVDRRRWSLGKRPHGQAAGGDGRRFHSFGIS